MKEIRRLTITTTRRVRVAVLRAHCPACGGEVATIAPHEASAVLGVSRAEFEGLVAAGRIHTIPLVNGGWRICQRSLFG